MAARKKPLSNIYGLYDINGVLLYIGKADCLQNRLTTHLSAVSRGKSTPLANWIRKHGIPDMRLVEANCLWEETERRLIAEGRARDECRLNLADGGSAPYVSIEQRRLNGKITSRSRASTPSKSKLWKLLRDLGDALKRGYVTDKTLVLMQSRPDVFGKLLAKQGLLPQSADIYASG